jgi:hypothetical protein
VNRRASTTVPGHQQTKMNGRRTWGATCVARKDIFRQNVETLQKEEGKEKEKEKERVEEKEREDEEKVTGQQLGRR